MKLTPVEILKHLGFTVPAEGVDINPNDTFLHVTTLQALGATMNIMAVPKETLEGLHFGIVGLASAWRGTERATTVNEDSLAKLQMTIASLLKVYYQRPSPELASSRGVDQAGGSGEKS